MTIEQSVTTSANPTVIVEQANGNLAVRGWEEERVWVRSSQEEYHVDQRDDQVTIRFEHDGEIAIPTGSTLIVQTGHGNTQVSQVEGEVSIERVHGNLTLHATGPLAIEAVLGNLTAKQIEGDVSVERVSGNATFQQIDGNLAVETCQGHFTVRDVAGDVQSSVSGNANLRLSPPPAHTISVDARGNINCRIPTTIDSRVTLKADGRLQVSHLPLPEADNQTAFTLGEGTGQIRLEARGNLMLAGFTPGEEDEFEGGFTFDYDFDFDFGQTQEMMRQFSEQLEAQAREWARQFEARFADINSGDEIAAKVQEKVQRALRQAEEKIAQAARRAEEKANRRAERAAARAARRGYTGHGPMPRHPISPGAMPIPPVPPVPPRPAAPTVSDEERMRILRMLEEGKISVDQAETLLAALEG